MPRTPCTNKSPTGRQHAAADPSCQTESAGRIPIGSVALRMPIFQAAHDELRSAIEPPWPRWMRDLYGLAQTTAHAIDVDSDETSVPAALGALGSRLRHRLELLASVAGGLQKQGWTLHIDGDT